MIVFVNHSCMECNFFCINRRSLGNHLCRTHKQMFPNGIKNYVMKHFLDNKIPLCKCGCDKEVLWHKSKYKFNDYVNGHNPIDYSTRKKTVYTTEQIENFRYKSIKNYLERGDEIKKKISDKIRDNHKNDPSIREKMSQSQLKKWSDPTYHKMMSKKRKDVWDKNYDSIYEKIFTPEFGKKMSIANSKRESTRTSKQESAFTKHLKSIFGEKKVQKKWINLKERSLCPDVYLVDYNIFIEWDGIYWHGFLKKSKWDYQQTKNIINDINKNFLSKNNSLNLLRIKSDININNISSYEDLIQLSYHHVVDGIIHKEGTFKIDNHMDIELYYKENFYYHDSEKSNLLMLKFIENYKNYWQL